MKASNINEILINFQFQQDAPPANQTGAPMEGHRGRQRRVQGYRSRGLQGEICRVLFLPA